MKVVFTFAGGLQLTYQLNDSSVARDWCARIAALKPENLNNRLNHRHGFALSEEVAARIDDLKRLTQQLGLEFHGVDQESLNVLHRAFPEFHFRKAPPDVLKIANEFNLLIHWLEYELNSIQLFNLDFNDAPSSWPSAKIPKHEMGHFSTDYKFGDLHLHYIHVGRCFHEMFMAKDFTSPKTHFVPQHFYTATCGLVFMKSKIPGDMYQFFDQHGGKAFFNYAFDDPFLAKGYFQLGSLEGYTTDSEQQELLEALRNTTVVGWETVHT